MKYMSISDIWYNGIIWHKKSQDYVYGKREFKDTWKNKTKIKQCLRPVNKAKKLWYDIPP